MNRSSEIPNILALDQKQTDELIDFCGEIYDSVFALDRNSTREEIAKFLGKYLILNKENPFDLLVLKKIILKMIRLALDDHPAKNQIGPIFKIETRRILAIKNN